MATAKRLLLFLVPCIAVVILAGLSGRLAYRYLVPEWRRVEIEWTDGVMKAQSIAAVVRSAKVVVLGDSVALRGIDAACLDSSLGRTANLAFSSADLASYYATVAAIQGLGVNLRAVTAIVVAYPDFFAAWSNERAACYARLSTTPAGAFHLLRYDAMTPWQILQRVGEWGLEETWYRAFVNPVQATALRKAVLGELPDPGRTPDQFIAEPLGYCPCDEEILPYHRQEWSVENHRCGSGSEPSFALRPIPSTDAFSKRNDPTGIPDDYPYTGYGEILSFLSSRFSRVFLVGFPDKFGLADRDGFDAAMRQLAEQGSATYVSLTDLDVGSMFYDEHHATPEGMKVLTPALADRIEAALHDGR